MKETSIEGSPWFGLGDALKRYYADVTAKLTQWNNTPINERRNERVASKSGGKYKTVYEQQNANIQAKGNHKNVYEQKNEV